MGTPRKMPDPAFSAVETEIMHEIEYMGSRVKGERCGKVLGAEESHLE